MRTPHKAGLLTATAIGSTLALVLSTTGSSATATPPPAPAPVAAPVHAAPPAPPAVPAPARPAQAAHPVPAARAAAPAPEVLRKAATSTVKAIDNNLIRQQAAAQTADCTTARQPAACQALTAPLGQLTRARTTLERQAASPNPDLRTITSATTDAVGATAEIAKDRHDSRGLTSALADLVSWVVTPGLNDVLFGAGHLLKALLGLLS
ncbi:hypothetical protein ACFP1Z_29315 [Streptomyces gamaensis]|uniref:Uncharacterized protein n=1 Tax=Streptomyces gamaensis TaxID=1763542 RepID=A0ABW0ZBC2_9ACTN